MTQYAQKNSWPRKNFHESYLMYTALSCLFTVTISSSNDVHTTVVKCFKCLHKALKKAGLESLDDEKY